MRKRYLFILFVTLSISACSADREVVSVDTTTAPETTIAVEQTTQFIVEETTIAETEETTITESKSIPSIKESLNNYESEALFGYNEDDSPKTPEQYEREQFYQYLLEQNNKLYGKMPQTEDSEQQQENAGTGNTGNENVEQPKQEESPTANIVWEFEIDGQSFKFTDAEWEALSSTERSAFICGMLPDEYSSNVQSAIESGQNAEITQEEIDAFIRSNQ